MRFPLARIGIFSMVVLFIVAPLHAQEPVQVVGSGIVEPLMQALVANSETNPAFDINVTGTNSGFAAFCAGDAAMTMANRAISESESAQCGSSNIAYVELTLGENIIAFISHPGADFAACLASDELTSIFAPSSAGEITNWNQVILDNTAPEDLALTVIVPGELTPEYAVLDRIIEGDGIRADATVVNSADDMIAAVSETPGAIGLVTLPQALAAGDQVQILDLQAAGSSDCQSPTAATVEDDLYQAADKLFLYVNATTLDQADVPNFLEYAITAAETVDAAGFTPTTETTMQQNQQNLDAAVSGEVPVAAAADEFQIAPGTTGAVAVGGSGEGVDFTKAVSAGVSTLAQGISATTTLEGDPAGFRRFCNGELDIVYSYRDMNSDEAANCEANAITPLTVDIGTKALVLLANAESDYLSCLTTDELVSIWATKADALPTTWSEINPDYPDTAMTLFAPALGNQDIDLLLLAASGESLASRVDIQLNDDPLYRAAATANVEGALTFMEWPDYNDVLANNQQNVSLVAVDNGSGCVLPDLNSIADGSYPLTRSGKFIVNRQQLIRPEVQSYLWFAFTEQNLTTFEDNDFVNVRVADLNTTRLSLEDSFKTVAAEAQAAAEATAEATVEATAEATATATEAAQ